MLAAKSGIINKGTISSARMRELGGIFVRLHNEAREKAAEEATRKSQETFRTRTPIDGRPARPHTDPRPRRPTTQGAFPDFLSWVPHGNDLVAFNLGRLQAVAPIYWLVQEIGTGKEANVKQAGGKAYRVSVAAQRGRPIPRGLTWSGATGVDQIVPGRVSSDIRTGGPGRGQIIITQEIKGKGYIRLGANHGFRTYRDEIEKAWRRIYGRNPKR